jgi:hypothetical protein
MYWIDNIKLDIPPLLGEEHHFEFMCDHKLSTDIPGDLKWCWCGQRISEPIGDDPAETQLHWQQERVNRLLEEVV